MGKIRIFRHSILVCIFLAAFSVAAVDIEGFGIADDSETATNLALKDLASRIEVRIIAATVANQEYVKSEGSESYSVDISTDVTTIVDLPIYGAELKTLPKNNRGEYRVKATLYGASAVPLYVSKAEDLRAELDSLYALQKNQNPAAREESLKQLLAGIKLYKKYGHILSVLASDTIVALSVSEAAVSAELRSMQGTLDTIQKAAAYLTEDIEYGRIYVYPPSAPSSSEITDFASAMQGALNAQLSTVMSPGLADYIFKGSYSVGSEGMDIHYSLISLKGPNAGSIATAVSARLHPRAYAGMKWEPSGQTIDALIQEGLVVSSGFSVDVTTNIGRRDLLFHNGDMVELLVKMNAPGYFFVLSHIDNDEGAFSYLLDINAGVSGNRRFVFYVGPDDVNKWISLGEFRAQAPYGVERLQFMASSVDPVDTLPGFRYKNGYFVVGDDSNDAIIQTRGLQRVQTAEEKKTAESTVTLTVLP